MYCKHFFRTLFFFFSFGILSYSSQAQTTAAHDGWLHDYDTAVKAAKADHKPILMVFAGSDWCKPCILLRKEVWDTPEFSKYAKDNLVLLELDFPRFKKNQLPAEQVKHNEHLAELYNKNGEFPLVVIVDESGKVISKTGYKAGGPEAYVRHLEDLLQNK